jgi:hypothetical protein
MLNMRLAPRPVAPGGAPCTHRRRRILRSAGLESAADLHPDISHVLYSEATLKARIQQLGRELAHAYAGRDLLVIGVRAAVSTTVSTTSRGTTATGSLTRS